MPHHAVSDKKSDPKGPHRDLRNAWIAVALIPVAFAAAIVLGEVVIGALGYPAGGKIPPGIGGAEADLRVHVGCLPGQLVERVM